MRRILSTSTRQSNKVNTYKTRHALCEATNLSKEHRRASRCLVQQMTMRQVDRGMLIRLVMVGTYCQVSLSRCLMLHLGTWLVASLGFLYLPSGQLHVRIPHPLLIQLILSPEQHLQADSKLALG